MGGNNPEKPLTAMKQLLLDGAIVGELALQKALKNREDSEKKISKWCKETLSM